MAVDSDVHSRQEPPGRRLQSSWQWAKSSTDVFCWLLSSAGAGEQLSQGLPCLPKKHTVVTLSLLWVLPAGLAHWLSCHSGHLCLQPGLQVRVAGDPSPGKESSVCAGPDADPQEIGTGWTTSNNRVLQFSFSILFEVL